LEFWTHTIYKNGLYSQAVLQVAQKGKATFSQKIVLLQQKEGMEYGMRAPRRRKSEMCEHLHCMQIGGLARVGWEGEGVFPIHLDDDLVGRDAAHACPEQLSSSPHAFISQQKISSMLFFLKHELWVLETGDQEYEIDCNTTHKTRSPQQCECSSI